MGWPDPILAGAVFLVNLYEQETSPEGIRSAWNGICRTQVGAKLCETLFAVNKFQETI